MVKQLTRQGNSACLIIDRQLLELMDLEKDSPVKISIEGRRMIVEPLTREERAAFVRKVVAKTGKENAALFRKLAK